MPRPPLKRKRFTPSQPPNRVQKSPTISPRAAREALDRDLKDTPIGARPENSDDSDQLVRTAPFRRNRQGRGRVEIYASGGVAKGDVPGAHPSRKRSLRSSIIRDKGNETSAIPHGGLGSSRLARPVPAKPKSPLSRETNAPPVVTTIPTQNVRSSPPVPTTHQRPTDTPLAWTPNGAISFLGTLKPRRRQNSILHLVENDANDDSTAFSLGDDVGFLPDAVSTPVDVGKPKAESILRRSSLLSDTIEMRPNGANKIANTSSRSGLDAAQLQETIVARQPVTQISGLKTLPLPNPTAKLSRVPRRESDLMAPPESSSSPVSSPAKSLEPSPVKGRSKRQANVGRPIATKDLQRMMPQKPRSRRERKQTQAFDIPSDSSLTDPPPSSSPEQDEESFLPSSKLRRNTKKGRTKPSRNGQKPNSTLSPITANSRSAKSPSQLRNTSSKVTKPTKVKGYTSTSRRPAKRPLGIGNGKENRRNDTSSKDMAGHARGNDGDVSDSEGLVSDSLKAQRDMFAEIDKWEMKFEEVDLPSSDPLMR